MAKNKRGYIVYEGRKRWVRGETMEEVEFKKSELKFQLEHGINLEEGNTTVKAWAETWFEVYKKRTSAKNWRNEIQRKLNKVIIPNIGSMKLKEVKPVHLQSLLNKYHTYSYSYQNHLRGILADMFGRAWADGMILSNPAAKLLLANDNPPGGRRPLTPKEREVFLEIVETYYYGLFLKTLYYTAMRPGEAAALRWRNVDFKNKVIHVVESLKANENAIRAPKTDAGRRDVVIPDVLLKDLEAAKENHKPDDFVFHMKDGRQILKYGFENIWGGFMRRFQVVYREPLVEPKLVMYDLRHNAITMWQEWGVPINIAKEMAGHSSADITSRIYTHATSVSINIGKNLINQGIKNDNLIEDNHEEL